VDNPIFWLGVSLGLVAVSLTAVLIAALPVLQELARASRSAEKLFDTLRQEFPPTLEIIRSTGQEINELSNRLEESVQTATGVVKQVDQSISQAKYQVKQVEIGSKSFLAGVKAAWKVWQRPSSSSPKRLNDPNR
jgi:uncharacterized protein YoxC